MQTPAAVAVMVYPCDKGYPVVLDVGNTCRAEGAVRRLHTRSFRGRFTLRWASELGTVSAMHAPWTAAIGAATVDDTAAATCWNERFMGNDSERSLGGTGDGIVRHAAT